MNLMFSDTSHQLPVKLKVLCAMHCGTVRSTEHLCVLVFTFQDPWAEIHATLLSSSGRKQERRISRETSCEFF